MDTLFIFPQAQARDANVIAWLDGRRGELGTIGRLLVDRLRACGNDIGELMHDGRPTLCVEMAAFAYVDVYTRHAAIGFFEAVSLPDPENLLTGQGKRMRHVKLHALADLERPALSHLIAAAYQDMRQRLGAEPAP